MAISTFDIFSVGMGPSSSHTVGPMRAAKLFAERLAEANYLPSLSRIKVELFGSLGATGKGHGTPKAIMLGLSGETPESVDVETIPARLEQLRESGLLAILGQYPISYIEKRDLLFSRDNSLPYHSNGMQLTAFDKDDKQLDCRVYYSVGGGFVVDEDAASADCIIEDQTELPYNFDSGDELLALCEQHGLSISELMLANEKVWRTEDVIQTRLIDLWRVMQHCIERGCVNEGILPGGLRVKRRAPDLFRTLCLGDSEDPLDILDWVSLYALAVNEENAAGGRLVTAPTNGAAGIIPAVLSYYLNFCRPAKTLSANNLFTNNVSTDGVPVNNLSINNLSINKAVSRSGKTIMAASASTMHYLGVQSGSSVSACDAACELEVQQDIVNFFLTAAAIGILFKKNASISGAEVGCQGEVGSACSMAAGGLAALMGGTVQQIENAAEIAMEHNLGLTCDPVGGLVQVPCIERNAMASVKAIHAARMALKGDGTHFVSLDKVIKTMRETGRDMQDKYKETARGGLATHVIEVPVNIIEC